MDNAGYMGNKCSIKFNTTADNVNVCVSGCVGVWVCVWVGGGRGCR